MNFLPQDYTAPKTSGYYMKLQEGENKIRILSKPIMGWEDWQDKKPLRFRLDNKPLKSIDPKKPVKHFWSFIVWNHLEEQIQILHITQATIRNCIEALCKDTDWGDPYFFDIKIIKKGEGVDTEYMVNPLPHKPIGEYVKQCFVERRCYLDAIFDNADPFALEWGTFTEGIFDKTESALAQPALSEKAINELNNIISKCDPTYVTQLKETLTSVNGSDKIADLPLSLYERIKAAAIKKRDEYQNLIDEERFVAVGL